MSIFKRFRDDISDFMGLWKVVGTKSTVQWALIRISSKIHLNWPESWRVHPRQLQQELLVRLRGTSDINVFNQIFIRQEYSSLRNLENVLMVLDLGANVGYSSAYFLSCFPNSRVVAVEPDERNVAVCKVNLEPYGDRVQLLRGAAWSERTALFLARGAFGDGREWATQVVRPTDGNDGSVQAWDVGSLMNIAGAGQVDLLKVDIERAELAVFSDTAKDWLPKVHNICIELHGPDCDEAFFNALADFDYELGHAGGLTICKNIRPRTGAN